MFYLVPFGKWAKTIKASLTSFSSFHATYRLQYLKNYQKIRDFLLFSRGIERAKWFGMGYTGCVANAISRTISLKLNWIRTVSFLNESQKYCVTIYSSGAFRRFLKLVYRFGYWNSVPPSKSSGCLLSSFFTLKSGIKGVLISRGRCVFVCVYW